jgi:protein involved in polysaccharide export with SLBB domain
VSSLSTPLNALFAAGGVTGRGSLRRLEHYRGKQLVEEVDAYDLLLHGIRGEVKRLENGDSLRVPPLGISVTVEGMVRRPAQYELREEKSLGEVLDLAGGILPAAALQHIEVQRLDAHEKKTMLSLEIGETSDKEALRSKFENFKVQDGDEIHIFPIAPYNTGALYIEGHVLRPGRYSYRDGMKLTDLITSYKDLLPEPSERYAEIIRIVAPENRPVVESFNLAAAVGNPESAPKLQPLDTVRIFGRYDFEAAPEFTMLGEVRHPGRYRSSEQAHLRDAIYQAGGETAEAWGETVQLFRAMPDSTTKVFSISLHEALAGDPLNNIRVERGDRILVHRQPERVSPRSVYIRGDVARPGRYPLAANMRVSDLVRSAGEFLRSANSASGDLTHLRGDKRNAAGANHRIATGKSGSGTGRAGRRRLDASRRRCIDRAAADRMEKHRRRCDAARRGREARRVRNTARRTAQFAAAAGGRSVADELCPGGGIRTNRSARDAAEKQAGVDPAAGTGIDGSENISHDIGERRGRAPTSSDAVAAARSGGAAAGADFGPAGGAHPAGTERLCGVSG